jgi:hypothetical protein
VSEIQAQFNVKLSNVDKQQYIIGKFKWGYISVEFKKGHIRKKYFFSFRLSDDK